MNKLWQLRVVPESLPDFADRRIDAVLDVDKDFLFPEAPGDFIACNNLAVPGYEEGEEFKGLSLELKPAAVAGEFEFVAMEAELAERIDGNGQLRLLGWLKYSIRPEKSCSVVS